MSKKNKTVIVDMEGAIAILRNRGIVVDNKTNLAKKYNVTNATFLNWQKQANPAVKFIWDFCNETGLTFEELVKEI